MRRLPLSPGVILAIRRATRRLEVFERIDEDLVELCEAAYFSDDRLKHRFPVGLSAEVGIATGWPAKERKPRVAVRAFLGLVVLIRRLAQQLSQPSQSVCMSFEAVPPSRLAEKAI
jgi:hypothetical protein